LAPGSTVVAVLRITDVGSFPPATCGRTTAAGLRVYPPNETVSKVVPFPFGACARRGPRYLSVESVSAGATTTSTTCQPSQLAVTESGSGGAAGTIEDTFTLTNTSTTTCTLYGYPGMALLSASGSELPTNVIRGGGLNFENIAPTFISLSPTQSSLFNLGFSDVVQGTTGCSVASQVEITPPNDYSFLTVPVTTIDACGNGTMHVSAVFASSDSAATSTTAPHS
jgi:hypothetical protein